MADDRTRSQGRADELREVDASDVVDIPEGSFPFNDVMVRSLLPECGTATSSTSAPGG